LQNQSAAHGCSELPATLNSSNVSIDVRSYASFGALANVGCPIDGSGTFSRRPGRQKSLAGRQ